MARKPDKTVLAGHAGISVRDLERFLYAGNVGLEPWHNQTVLQAARDPAFHRHLLLLESFPATVADVAAHDGAALQALLEALRERDVRATVTLERSGHPLEDHPDLAGPVYCVLIAPPDKEPDEPASAIRATEWDAVYVFAPDRETAVEQVAAILEGEAVARPRIVMTEAQLRGCAAELRRVRLRQLPPTDPLE